MIFVQKQYDLSIKQFQSDKGGGFKAFQTLLFKGGFNKIITCPYTFSQNRVIESKNRQVVKIGLSLLIRAS